MVSLCGKCGAAVSFKVKKKRYALVNGELMAKCGSCKAVNKVEVKND